MASEGGPQVIVRNRELALMNFISTIFFYYYHLLC